MCGRYVSPDEASIERGSTWCAEAGRKAPYSIHLNDQPVFAFAGLWDRSIKADGTAVESVVHITIPANDLMKSIHNTGSNPHRMPAILRREDQEAWPRVCRRRPIGAQAIRRRSTGRVRSQHSRQHPEE